LNPGMSCHRLNRHLLTSRQRSSKSTSKCISAEFFYFVNITTFVLKPVMKPLNAGTFCQAHTSPFYLPLCHCHLSSDFRPHPSSDGLSRGVSVSLKTWWKRSSWFFFVPRHHRCFSFLGLFKWKGDSRVYKGA
jgi:hypothetical protein